MAKLCQRCGKHLGFLARRGGGAHCSDCRAELQRERDAGATTYRAALLRLASGDGPLSELLTAVQASSVLQELAPSQRRSFQDEAFRKYADRILADDIISLDEEKDFEAITDALGIGDEDIQARFRDLLHRIVVARANDGRMPVLIDPHLMTKRGEVVHAEMEAALMKEVAVREFRGGYSGFSFRVMKGVRYHTGATRGRSVVIGTEMQVADVGVFAVSSQRVAFIGSRQTLEIPYGKLVGMEVFIDGIRVNASNRKNAPLFKLESGDTAAAMINGAMQRLED